MSVEIFGPYELLECIGSGGMAEVFRARYRDADGALQLLALKRLHQYMAKDRDILSMFLDEAGLTRDMRHENIVGITDVGTINGQHYIAMEHIHGRTLLDVYRLYRVSDQRLPLGFACHIIKMLCLGLDYAHNYQDTEGRARHLVHRDVSPDNVMISFDGRVQIIDFGIAKAVGRCSTTGPGVIKGKIAYMSPEQLRWLPVDRRSDVFACGIVLFELLTGARLFHDSKTEVAMRKIRQCEVPEPRELNPSIPAELQRIVLRALALQPDDRYQSAAELAAALDAFMQSQGLVVTPGRLGGWLQALYAVEYTGEAARLHAYTMDPLAVPSASSFSMLKSIIERSDAADTHSAGIVASAASVSYHTTVIGWQPAEPLVKRAPVLPAPVPPANAQEPRRAESWLPLPPEPSSLHQFPAVREPAPAGPAADLSALSSLLPPPDTLPPGIQSPLRSLSPVLAPAATASASMPRASAQSGNIALWLVLMVLVILIGGGAALFMLIS